MDFSISRLGCYFINKKLFMKFDLNLEIISDRNLIIIYFLHFQNYCF